MNIQLNTSMHGIPTTTLPSAGETKAAPARAGWAASAKGVDDLVSVGGEIEVPDAALDRNDALGNLVKQAFGL